MGFYIRKAFKTGPVRLNLSKGGLGLSAGVTGARAGINSRGTYVHAGRHGLYYRKYSRKGGKQSRKKAVRPGRKEVIGRDRSVNDRESAFHERESGTQRSMMRPQKGDTVYLFRDTGVTFESKSNRWKSEPASAPSLPSNRVLTGAEKAVFSISGFLLLAWMFFPAGHLLMLVLLAAGFAGSRVFASIRWRRRVQQRLEEIVREIESEKVFRGDGVWRGISVIDHSAGRIITDHDWGGGALGWRLPWAGVRDRWIEWYVRHLHAVVAEMAMRREEVDTLETLRRLDENVPAGREWVCELRALLLGRIIEEMLEDHLLSEEEEGGLRNLIESLDLPESFTNRELERLEYFSLVRREIERPLEAIEPDLPLLRGEQAYEEFETARLLNERVQRRFQRNRVQYREIGYEIDMEGTLLLTDRRLLMVGRGSREYRLNKVLDVTVDPDAGIVELTLAGRASPVIITVKKPLILAARVEKVIEKIIRETKDQ